MGAYTSNLFSQGERYEESESESSSEDEAALARSPNNRGRSYKMVFVANTSLKMGAGKMAAQVGHATLGVYQQAMRSEAGREMVKHWTRVGQVKIVVKGESTEQLVELSKASNNAGVFSYLVADAGYTQIPAGSRTVLAVFGPVEQVDAITGGLKLL